MDSHLSCNWKGISVSALWTIARGGSRRLGSVFVAKENQIIMWSVLQTVLRVYIFHFGSQPCSQLYRLQAHNFPFCLLFTSCISKRNPERFLRSFRACSPHPRGRVSAKEWGRRGHHDWYIELTILLRAIQKKEGSWGNSMRLTFIAEEGIFKDLNEGSLHCEGSGRGGLD